MSDVWDHILFDVATHQLSNIDVLIRLRVCVCLWSVALLLTGSSDVIGDCGFLQLLNTLASDLDYMLSDLCTTPPPPYQNGDIVGREEGAAHLRSVCD